ncbi:aspartate aminotransferase family protein [uncultured Ruminococcus sp.]|uniref:class-III pyridoxal-phosphate-dependent aminotransferase n=1 Tax=uncultured Ruminococcus sp. TaxID=165186 RepID=UPI0025CEE72D|nr:aminotransferase class III-fold pyridoxal phosphate-dependent enzyme [uncultured Ruminococcus sp.]
MSFLNDPNITKADIIDKSIRYWNPSKTQEWIDRGMSIVIGKREGYYFWDMDGRKFLNIHINGGTYNLGHRNPEVIKALVDATEELDVGNHHFPGITKALLAEKLANLCPEGLDYVCYSTCGGEAVDVAIKSARYATKRKKVISIKGCYHGHTGLSVSTGDAVFKDPFLCQGEPGCFVQVPLNDLDAMEAELKKEDAACVIIESLLATYGFPIPDKGYLAGVKKLCEKYGTLYIADEVQTGLMRTGKMWCFEHEGFVPDMIVTAKGFGGGIYPISATIMNRKAGSWLFDIGRMHGSTCGGSELGCAVAMKVLDISTRPETVALVKKNTARLTEGITALKEKYDGFFRGFTQRGVIMGLDFDCKDASVSVTKPLFDNGVWAHNSRLRPNILQIKLGLLCDDAFLDELFEKMDKGLAQAVKMR